jgi:hypothetical protein
MGSDLTANLTANSHEDRRIDLSGGLPKGGADRLGWSIPRGCGDASKALLPGLTDTHLEGKR